MKILFCANIYKTGIVGPARFAEQILQINELFKGQHEVRILTSDTMKGSSFIYPMPFGYPRIIHSLDVLLRSYSYFKYIKKLKKNILLILCFLEMLCMEY